MRTETLTETFSRWTPAEHEAYRRQVQAMYAFRCYVSALPLNSLDKAELIRCVTALVHAVKGEEA